LPRFRSLHRERQTMSEQKTNEAWVGGVALSTAVIAVFAAVTTLYVGKFSSRAVLFKAEESNQWAYFQAKSIKGHTYEIQKERLELEVLSSGGRISPNAARKCREMLDEYKGNIVRYDKEKAEIREKAETLGTQGKIAQERAGDFGYGLIFLQISIMLSSVAALTRKRMLWYFGLLSVLGGVFFFLDGIFLFF